MGLNPITEKGESTECIWEEGGHEFGSRLDVLDLLNTVQIEFVDTLLSHLIERCTWRGQVSMSTIEIPDLSSEGRCLVVEE